MSKASAGAPTMDSYKDHSAAFFSSFLSVGPNNGTEVHLNFANVLVEFQVDLAIAVSTGQGLAVRL